MEWTEIQDRFSDLAPLLPVPYGEKGPRFPGWQNSKGSLCADEIHLLEEGRLNAAVLLVNGLGCIDIDDDSAEEAFMELNPGLRDAIGVKGLKGRKIFVRWRDGYPEGGSRITENGATVAELLGEKKNATIYGRHPAGMQYRNVGGSEIPLLSFRDIKWPEGWSLGKIVSGEEAQNRKIIEDLEKRFGKPYRVKTDQEGNEIVTRFGERFWAALVAAESSIIYDPVAGCFWKYHDQDGLYHRETSERIREIISERLFIAAEVERRPEIRDLVTVGRVAPIVEALKGVAEGRQFFEDAEAGLHVGNGRLVESEDGLGLVLEDGFSPEHRARNRSPYHYDPAAQCPRFLEELLGPMLDKDDIDLLQRWAGLAILGRNIAQKILLLDGTPGRGKGVLQRILRELVGSQNCSELRTAHLGERFETNRFVGKTLLVGSDVPGNFLEMRWASTLKALTGGDLFTVEAKNRNEGLDLRGEFNVLIVSNSRLRCRLDGDAGAWARRLLILRTEAPEVEKKIPDLDRQILREEGSGILAWAVAGFLKAKSELDEHGDLVLTSEQRKKVQDLLAESQALELFIRDGVQVDHGSDLTSEEIEGGVADFCVERGWRPPPVSEIRGQTPDLMLRVHGVTRRHDIKRDGRSRRGFGGVRILSAEEQEGRK